MKWDHNCFLIARLDKKINRPAPAKWVALFLLKGGKYASKLQKRAGVLDVRTQMDGNEVVLCTKEKRSCWWIVVHY
jgi:hypothetical protein